MTRLQRLVAFVRDALVHSAPLPTEGPRSRVAVLAVVAVNIVALVFLVENTRRTLRPLFSEAPPPPIRAEGPGDQRFELDEKTRKSIFAELAALELSERKRNIDQNTWNGHLWSREDDRGWQERVLARSLARRHGVSISQIFLVLEEGIRSKWPAPDGKPLPANAEPLKLRTGW